MSSDDEHRRLFELFGKWSLDNHQQLARANLEAALSSAALALRTIVLINGGAAVAILAFLGTLMGRTDKAAATTRQLEALTGSLAWFAIGVVFGALAMGLAYFTNLSSWKLLTEMKVSLESPFVEKTENSSAVASRTDRYQAFAVAAFFLSLAAFVAGVALIYCRFAPH